MTDRAINSEILSYIQSLEKAEKLSVLAYLKSFVKKEKKKNKNEQFLSLAGSINKIDMLKMEQSIEESCEHVDKNEW